MITTEILLENIVEGVPSGNYDGSSTEWFSDAVQAADYYRGRGGIQTFLIRVRQFTGDIILEATLDTDPDTASWFAIYTYGPYIEITDYHPVTVFGNFVWLRAHVMDFGNFLPGEPSYIDLVSVTY